MILSVNYEFLPKQRTVRTSQVMDLFGIDFEQGQHVVAEGLELPVEQGSILCFTGDSGSGKSSMMRAVCRQIEGVVDVNALELQPVSLIDGLEMKVTEGMALLASCGLGEAHLMLRTPAELSDGQRYRYRIALAISRQPAWIAADEFTAALDRTLAKVIAFNVRKICDRTGIGFLVATTHDNIVSDLNPDVHVICRLGDEPVVVYRDENVKKKGSVLPGRSGPVKRPESTGRILLGGIIDRMTSASSSM